MRLPLQDDNSSMVINLHCTFEVGAHFLHLDDNFYQILSIGNLSETRLNSRRIYCFQLSPSLRVLHLKEQTKYG
jgi:hypothetical protein